MVFGIKHRTAHTRTQMDRLNFKSLGNPTPLGRCTYIRFQLVLYAFFWWILITIFNFGGLLPFNCRYYSAHICSRACTKSFHLFRTDAHKWTSLFQYSNCRFTLRTIMMMLIFHPLTRRKGDRDRVSARETQTKRAPKPYTWKLFSVFWHSPSYAFAHILLK